MEENLNNSLKQKILAKKQLQNTQAPELSKDRVCILCKLGVKVKFEE